MRERLTDSYKKIMEEEVQLGISGWIFLEKEDFFFCLRNGTKGREMKGHVLRKRMSPKKRKGWQVCSGLHMELCSLSTVLRMNTLLKALFISFHTTHGLTDSLQLQSETT